MKTRVFDVTKLNENALAGVSEAAELLRKGGLVAFPTETVYGLGADALNPEAAGKVYAAKGRPSDNPMIVHIADPEDLERLTDQMTGPKGPVIRKLMEAFWPGPLTMVVEKKDCVPLVTTGGLNTVGVRMPDCQAALELIRRSGCPIAAPSANISGKPSPTKAAHVIADMDGKIEAILKGGDCRVGIESTVLDLTGEIPAILRPGMLTREKIAAVIGGKVIIDPAIADNRPRDVSGGPAPRAPGMKYTHYAPNAPMILFEGRQDLVLAAIEERKAAEEAAGKKVGVILFEETAFESAAHELFAKLRALDDENVDLILANAMNAEDSEGFAVMNRMMKAAGHRIIQV